MTITLLEKRTQEQDTKAYSFEVDSILSTSVKPITVEGDHLDINSGQLEVEKIYNFTYLDANMVLWKSSNNDINIYQIINE